MRVAYARSVIRSSLFSCAITVAIFAVRLSVQAQQTKISRIGYLSNQSPSQNPASANAFRQALQEVGYVEGKNLVIEWRSIDGKPDRYPALAAELVRLNVDVIVYHGRYTGNVGG